MSSSGTGEDRPYIVSPQTESEAAAGDIPEGWSRAQPEHLPRPTYWPAVAGLGITFICWGIATTYIIRAVGVLLLGIALRGWIGELLHGD